MKYWWSQQGAGWEIIQRLEKAFNISFTDKVRFIRMDYMEDFVLHQGVDKIPVRVSGALKMAAAPDGTIYFLEENENV